VNLVPADDHIVNSKMCDELPFPKVVDWADLRCDQLLNTFAKALETQMFDIVEEAFRNWIQLYKEVVLELDVAAPEEDDDKLGEIIKDNLPFPYAKVWEEFSMMAQSSGICPKVAEEVPGRAFIKL
jgi:hypothetical protein